MQTDTNDNFYMGCTSTCKINANINIKAMSADLKIKKATQIKMLILG